jgi:hypothetical protein
LGEYTVFLLKRIVNQLLVQKDFTNKQRLVLFSLEG